MRDSKKLAPRSLQVTLSAKQLAHVTGAAKGLPEGGGLDSGGGSGAPCAYCSKLAGKPVYH